MLCTYSFSMCIGLYFGEFSLNLNWKQLVFVLNWNLCFCISQLFTRENNVCDINPVHYLFATGTSEVSDVYVCVYDCVCFMGSNCFCVPVAYRQCKHVSCTDGGPHLFLRYFLTSTVEGAAFSPLVYHTC